MDQRSRISLGPSTAAEQNASNAFATRKRAASMASMPRKSILKQHVPVSPRDENYILNGPRPSLATSSSGELDFEQTISDLPSSLRSRKSDAARRVSFASSAKVRLFDKQAGTPSPIRVSPPNRIMFPSQEDYGTMSPLQKSLLSHSSRRYSDAATPPRRSGLQPAPVEGSRHKFLAESPSRPPRNPPIDVHPNSDDDHNALHANQSTSSDMSIVSHAPGIASKRQSFALGFDDGDDMSIAEDSMLEDSMHMHSNNMPRLSQIQTLTARQSAASDYMSVAATSRRPSTVSDPPELPAHEFDVPLGHRVPRTDTSGNILSPTQAEKDKAAAIASLAALNSGSEGGEEQDMDVDDYEDDDEAPVIPVRAGSDMSLDDATRRLLAATHDTSIEDSTSSTMSIDDAIRDFNAPQGERTVNITELRRKSLALQEVPVSTPSTSVAKQTVAPPSPAPLAGNARRSAIPVSSKPTTSLPSLSVFTATPSKSPTKLKQTFSANFAPPSVSPRKRALSVPPPSPSPVKKRALSAAPAPSPRAPPPKTIPSVPANLFGTRSPFKPTSSSSLSGRAPPPVKHASESVHAKLPFNPFLVTDSYTKGTHLSLPQSPVANASPSTQTSLKDVSDNGGEPHNLRSIPEEEERQLSENPISPQSAEAPPQQSASTKIDPPASNLSVLPASRVSLSGRPAVTPFSDTTRERGRLSQAIRPRRSSVVPAKALLVTAKVLDPKPTTAVLVPPAIALPFQRDELPAQVPPPLLTHDSRVFAAVNVSPLPPTPQSPSKQATPIPISPPPAPSTGLPPQPAPSEPRASQPSGSESNNSTSKSAAPLSRPRRESLAGHTQDRPRGRRVSFAPRPRASVLSDVVPQPTLTPEQISVDPEPSQSSEPVQDSSVVIAPAVERARASIARRSSLAAQRRRASMLPSNLSQDEVHVVIQESSSYNSQPSSQIGLEVQLSPGRPARRRSTFGRLSVAPSAPRMPRIVGPPPGPMRASAHVLQAVPALQRLPILDFIQEAGLEFQSFPADLPTQYHAADRKDGAENPGFSLSDILEAVSIHYPQLDNHEAFVDVITQELDRLEIESQEIVKQTNTNPPPIVLAWLAGNEQDREDIVTETRIYKATAAFQTQTEWYSWRLEITEQEYDRFTEIYEDLADFANMLDEHEDALPSIVDSLLQEFEQVQADLATEQSITEELGTCDQEDLAALRSELEMQNQEIAEQEESLRTLQSEFDALNGKQQEVDGQIAESRAALGALESKIQQSEDHSEDGLERLELIFEHLQCLLKWRLVWVSPEKLDLVYDSWFRVELVCENHDLLKVNVSLLPISSLSEKHAKFPILNDTVLALAKQAVSPLRSTDHFKVTRKLDHIFGSANRLNLQLRTLSFFPLKLELVDGQNAIRAKAKVILKKHRGRADVTFYLSEDFILTCPARIAELKYDVKLAYGEHVTDEEINDCITRILSSATPVKNVNILGSACAELRDLFS